MDVKKIKEQLAAVAGRRTRPSRSNRTLALLEPQTRILYGYCKFQGYYVQDVIDTLVADFLEGVKNELPPDSTQSTDPGDKNSSGAA